MMIFTWWKTVRRGGKGVRRAILLVLLLACGAAYPESIPLMHEHGTLQVPVVINDRIVLNFTIDSGASDVSIPADVFSTLIRTGTVSTKDLLDTRAYTLADGSVQSSQLFRILSLKIGTIELRDVVGSVAPAASPLLLGQSFLARLPSWSIDNKRQLLVLNESPTPSTQRAYTQFADVSSVNAGAFIFPEIAKLGTDIINCGISVNWSKTLDAQRSIQYIVSVDLNDRQARDSRDSDFSVIEARTAMMDLSRSPIPGYDGPPPAGLSFGVNSQTDLIRIDGTVGPSWTGGDEGMFRARIDGMKDKQKRRKLGELWNHLLHGEKVYVFWENSTSERHVFQIIGSVKPKDKTAILACVRDFESQRH
jgi:hypothetical protein